MFEQPVVWQSSWRVFKDAFRALGRRSGLVAGFLLGEVILMGILWQISGGAILFGNAEPLLQRIGLGVLALYMLVFSMAVIHIVLDREQKKFGELLFGHILPRLPAAIALSVLLAAAAVVGTLLFIVPGIVLYVYTSLALFILIVERVSVGDAIRRSIAYVRGWWWRVCSRLIFTMAMAMIISLISTVPLLGVLVSSILSLFAAPIVVAFVALTYSELAEKKRLLQAAPVSLGGKIRIALYGTFVLTLLVASSMAAQVVINESLTRRLIAPNDVPMQLFLDDEGNVRQEVLPLE